MPPAVKKLRLDRKKKSGDGNVTKKPTVISTQLEKQIGNKEKDKKRKGPSRGVLFIKHLPHGFFEEQLKKYFNQFGKVTRLRLVRSTKTGNSKGYAFIEFAVPEVAEIAAETMNNYLMFKKLVKASYIPPEEQKYNYFRTSVKKVINPVGKPVYVSRRTRRTVKKMKEQNTWAEEIYEKRAKKSLSKLKKLKSKYAGLGIDFNNLIATGSKGTERSNESHIAARSSSEHSKDDNTYDKDQSVPIKKLVTNLSSAKHSGKNKVEESKSGSLLRISKRPANSDSSENEECEGADTASKTKTLRKQSFNGSHSSDENDNPTNINDESVTEGRLVKKQKRTKLNGFENIQCKPLLGGVKKSKNKVLKAKAYNKKMLSIKTNVKQELMSKTLKEMLKSEKGRPIKKGLKIKK